MGAKSEKNKPFPGGIGRFRQKYDNNFLISFGIMIAIFLFCFLMIATGNATRHFKSLLVPAGINIILAISLNLVVGILGELSLGHAGFMSVGAYAGCLFSIYTQELFPIGVRFPLSLLVGGLVAAFFGLVIGVPVLRLKGDYLAIVTLAFGEIIRSVIINLDFTGGAAGLKNIEKHTTYTSVFIIILITLFVILNLINSRHGRAIMAIRDNRIAAESLGVNITYFKLLSFILAAFFAGIAGVLYGHNIGSLTAAQFDYNRSIEILVMVVLGGMGNIKGSIISAILITIIPEMLRGADKYRMLFYSIILIIMMLLNASPRFAEFKRKIRIKNLASALKSKSRQKEEV
ncbi:MAG TPA: branched-chain amino acid ABC transporter permease [Clostridiales bacterium]|nr:branched-chain amino acid ABC transporter permease [Clostridiales bacterium]